MNRVFGGLLISKLLNDRVTIRKMKNIGRKIALLQQWGIE